MIDYRQDPITLEWVIVSPKRSKRPDQSHTKKITCPFDEGNEGLTPPEITRVGPGEPNQPGWEIRVVPNLFKVTETHEVIIHSPDHNKDIAELPMSHVEKIFQVYQERYNVLEDKGLPLIFNNHGAAAGASLAHPHSQLTLIPANVGTTAPIAQQPYNIAIKTKSLVAFCPEFSVWPYETWIEPVPRGKTFGQADPDQVKELAGLVQRIVQSFEGAHPDLPYNFYIYPGEDWYLRIMGRSVTRAGFELGSGVQVNTVDPKEVVKILS